MTTRVLAMAGVLVLAVLLDTVVLSSLTLGVWRPDLVMLTVMGVALAQGSGAAVRYGFAAGLLVDLLSTSTRLVGTSALVFVLAGYALGVLRPYLAGGGLPARLVAVAATSVVAVLGGTLLDHLLEVTSAGLGNAVQLGVATGVVHALLTPVVVLPLEALSRLFPGSSGSERAQSVWQGP